MNSRTSSWVRAAGMVTAAVFVGRLPTGVVAGGLPPVSSGTLVLHLKADSTTVQRDGNNNVLSWTAQNDPSIVFRTEGPHLANIRYSPAGMVGHPTIEVNDFLDQSQVMLANVPEARTATTIFWLGYYDPGRGGSLGDGAGQYVYSYGLDGPDGSQLDHQIDNGLFQLYGGGGTQTGASITLLNGRYSVWRTLYGAGSGNGHEAYANGANLNIPSPNGGNYNVSGRLQLFGYQDSAGNAGFNFVGNMSELVIYDGILSAEDTAAVEAYLYEPLCACDTNCDGSINGFDIQDFIDVLSGVSSPCSPCAADTNDDGSINGFDIQGFIGCLGG